MVICKYFLRGTCRFGEVCKNEHTYNNENNASILRKKQDIEPSVLVKSVSNDMDKAEKGNQWPLSCYGPFQGKQCLPGFEDKCFEEIRLGMYEAERNGTVEQYRQQFTLLLQEARLKMRLLQNPTPEATNVLKELYNASSFDSASVFSHTQTTGAFSNNSNSALASQSASIFANTAPKPQSQSLFASPPGPFAIPENAGIFGNTQANTGSIFSQQQATKPTSFQNGNSIFGGGAGSTVAPNQSIFANTGPQQQQQQQPGYPSNNIFANQSQSIFVNAQPIHNNASPFGEAALPTGNSPFAAAAAAATAATGSNSPFAAGNSPFAASAPPTGNSPFSGAHLPAGNSPFTTTNQPAANGSPFSNATPFAAGQPPSNQSMFNQPAAGQSAFNSGPSMFSTNQMPAAAVVPDNKTTSIFAQPTVVTGASVFSNPVAPEQPFFAPVRNQPMSAVEHSASIFGGSTPNTASQPGKSNDPAVYSTVAELSDSDQKCYEAYTFEFGKIPELAPTVLLCS